MKTINDLLKTWQFDVILTVLVFVACFVAATFCGGCTAPIASKPDPWGWLPWHQNTSTTLNSSLDWFVGLGVFGLAIAAAVAYFFAPDHKLSLTIAAGAGTLIGTSLILKVFLPWLTLVGGALAVIGVIVLSYELYVKFKKGSVK